MITNRNCILLTANLGYLNYAEYVAWQIRRAGIEDLPILIASADAGPGDLSRDDAEILSLEISEFISALPQNARLKHFTYWRLPAFEEAAKTYDKILYLDTDFHICGNDFQYLFEIDMQGAPIAAVRDVHQSVRPDRVANEFEILGWDNAPYFNAGMLLIDGVKFRNDHTLEKIAKCAKENAHALTAHDQSLLNLVFYRNWLELSPVWNWQLSPRNFQNPGKFDLELVHLAGEVKPWTKAKSYIPPEFTTRYLKYSGQQSSDTSMKSNTVKYFLKNQWYLRQYRKWLTKFPNKFVGTIIG